MMIVPITVPIIPIVTVIFGAYFYFMSLTTINKAGTSDVRFNAELIRLLTAAFRRKMSAIHSTNPKINA